MHPLRTPRCLRLAALAVALASGLMAGCARNQVTGEEREVIYRAESVITIRVVNHSQLDVVVYVLHGGVRDRLGSVTAATTSSFAVQARVLGGTGEFVLLADPVGSPRLARTDVLRAREAGTFTWTLETNLDRGSILLSD